MRFTLLKIFNLCSLVLVLFLTQEVSARLVDDCRVTIAAVGLDICEGGTVDITATPTFEVQTYQWYKDGVLFRSGTSNVLAVSEAGTYSVRAIPIEDVCEEEFYESNTLVFTVSRRQTVTIVPTPPASGCAGDTYTFRISESFPEGTIYEWNFDDGTTQPTTVPTATHSFQALGAGSTGFTVSVTAITPLPGGCGYPAGNVSVTVQRQPDIPFDVSWEKEDGTTGAGNSYCVEKDDDGEEEDINIKPILTIPNPHAGVLEYFVDWGDGAGEQRRVAADFPLTGPAYTEVGDYDIKVRARGTNGCENVFETTFSVSEEPEASIEEEGRPTDPNAPAPDPDGKRRRRPSPREGTKGCEPIIIPFKSTSTGGGLTYKWEILKDGQPADPSTYEIESGGFEQETLELKFFVSGQYQAKLTVFNACGPEEGVDETYPFIVGYPQITMPPSEDICAPLPGEAPRRVSYNVTTDLNTESRSGDFIDFNFADQKKEFTLTIRHSDGTVTTYDESDNGPFSVVFDKEGTYTITAFAENECGTSDDAGGAEPQIVRVLPPLPDAPTVQGPPVSCPGGTVTINASLGSVSGVEFRLLDQQGNEVAVSPTGRFEIPTPPANTEYAVVAFNEVCTSPAAPVSVTVLEDIDNVITLTQTQICAGNRPAEITGNNPLEQVSTPSGVTVTYKWKRSTSATGPFTDAPSSSDSPNNGRNYRPGVLNETTYFVREVQVGNCTPVESNIITIEALPPITNNATIEGDQEVCADATPATLTGENPGGGNGNPSIEWQYSTTGANATDYVAAEGTNTEANYTFAGPISETRWYRRVARAGDCEVISNAVRVRVVDSINPNSNTLTPPNQGTTCTGTSPGIITGSTPTGATGTYTYEWQVSTTSDTGPYTIIPNATDRDYTPDNLTQTSWFRRIVRSGNCPENVSGAVRIQVVTVTAEDNTIRTTQPQVCSGTVPEQITGAAISGVTYRWESSISGPTSGFNPASGPNTAQNYTPPAITRDTWFRRVIISGTCENASEAVQLQVQPLPNAPILTVRDARACVGESATLTVANANGNTIEWFDAPTGGSPLFVGATFVTQELTQNATFYVQARNNNNCTNPTRTPVNVTVVTPAADAGPDVTIIQGRPAELRASGGVSYQWEPAASLSNANVANPVARPDVTTTYTVTITTEEGCTATDEVTVTVIPAITAPNAFSPNGDRVNDVWEIENIQNYPDARVEIFNRWGNQIFNSTGYATPWDGTYNGESLPVATYYYIIYLNSSEKPISGHVTIIR